MGLGAMLAAAAMLAQAAPAAEAGTPAEAAKVEQPKKICVEEQQIGSHFKKRICATEEEWTKRREKDAANMSRIRTNTPNRN